MKSILQTNKECFLCGTTYNLHEHHIFFGSANRKQSERQGLKCFLCYECHEGTKGVHHNRELDLELKKVAQQKFEETHTREEFRQIFGKSYL
jgi:hypothetical protein